jgi:hypothetical protein
MLTLLIRCPPGVGIETIVLLHSEWSMLCIRHLKMCEDIVFDDGKREESGIDNVVIVIAVPLDCDHHCLTSLLVLASLNMVNIGSLLQPPPQTMPLTSRLQPALPPSPPSSTPPNHSRYVVLRATTSVVVQSQEHVEILKTL